ncbi:LUD domain-containing protein [Streptomyces sp. NPDC021080]|uniref:LUD domain-containing protein n=1 Tax=Streptomyces sp. NPDC021080 TaxID=3365110 RepID=UPI0037A8C220
MTASTPTTSTEQATPFTAPATDGRLERVATALKERNFDVEILDDAAAARARVKDLIPEGSTVFTVASETLRLSGIGADINDSGRYDSVKARGLAMDRATQMAEIWRMLACPDVVVGSVCAVTETGSLVAASASGSQLPAYAGAAPRMILVVGAQKVVPDLETALRRIDEHCVPLEDERARQVYGVPSALNRLLVLNAEPHPGRGTVLLLREAIGF